MKRAHSAIASLGLLLAAQTASAADAVTWDFVGSPRGVVPHNLGTVQATEEGLYVETATDGFLEFPPLTRRADSAMLRVTNARDTDIAILWRTADLQPGEYYQHTVALPRGEHVDVAIALHQMPEWTWSAPFVGIAFPAGTQLLLEEMEWRGYTLPERLWNGFLSFWTPDTFRLYSINFLWGPLVGASPEARATLFDAMPPRAWSATRVFYGAFALVLVVAGVAAKAKHGGLRRFLAVAAIAGAALWVLFDVRMTQEILRYVRDDWTSYVLATGDGKRLRTHSGLHGVLERLRDTVGEGERYALVTREGTPFFANVRYALYPSVPVRQEEWDATIPVWIVLDAPEVTVRDGELVAGDGTVLASGGEVTERFDSSSFVYRLAP